MPDVLIEENLLKLDHFIHTSVSNEYGLKYRITYSTLLIKFLIRINVIHLIHKRYRILLTRYFYARFVQDIKHRKTYCLFILLKKRKIIIYLQLFHLFKCLLFFYILVIVNEVL